MWWVAPLNIIYVYPSWISSASRNLHNYHFTLLVVISSTPLSLVNKLETMYWRGANKSHWFIQKSRDSIWTLVSSFIHIPRNKAWRDIHCISGSHSESELWLSQMRIRKLWNDMSYFRIEVSTMQFIRSDFET